MLGSVTFFLDLLRQSVTESRARLVQQVPAILESPPATAPGLQCMNKCLNICVGAGIQSQVPMHEHHHSYPVIISSSPTGLFYTTHTAIPPSSGDMPVLVKSRTEKAMH